MIHPIMKRALQALSDGGPEAFKEFIFSLSPAEDEELVQAAKALQEGDLVEFYQEEFARQVAKRLHGSAHDFFAGLRDEFRRNGTPHIPHGDPHPGPSGVRMVGLGVVSIFTEGAFRRVEDEFSIVTYN